ncbi:MAG: hypothetical protein AAF828_12370 [Bacteroidota bacterium]
MRLFFLKVKRWNFIRQRVKFGVFSLGGLVCFFAYGLLGYLEHDVIDHGAFLLEGEEKVGQRMESRRGSRFSSRFLAGKAAV